MKSLAKSAISSIVATALSIAAIATTASAITEKSARSGLTKINGVWTGTFNTSEVSTYSNTFYDPNTFRLTAGGYTSKLRAETNYTGNYKWASVMICTEDGFTTQATSPSESANNSTVTATISCSEELRYGRYYGYMNDGTGEGSSYLERCLINVNKK